MTDGDASPRCLHPLSEEIPPEYAIYELEAEEDDEEYDDGRARMIQSEYFKMRISGTERAVNVDLKTYIGGRGLCSERAAGSIQPYSESRTSDDTMRGVHSGVFGCYSRR